MFDVKCGLHIILNPTEGSNKFAMMNIQVRGGGPDETDTKRGQWFVLDSHLDHRLPHLRAGEPYVWHWHPAMTDTIVLTHPNGAWAWLVDFPANPTPATKGFVTAFRMPGGPSKLPDGRYHGSFYVNEKAKHGNMPDPDRFLGTLGNLIKASRPSGWTYSGAWGAVAAGGVVVGGGAGFGHLVLKRRGHGTMRQVQLGFKIAGIGLMTPGGGVTGSTESMDTTMFKSEVRLAPVSKTRLEKAADFAGSVLVLDAGIGGGMGPYLGLGANFDGVVYVFTDGWLSGTIPDPTSAKAFLVTGSGSVLGAKNKKTGGKTTGASGTIFGGPIWVEKKEERHASRNTPMAFEPGQFGSLASSHGPGPLAVFEPGRS